MNLAPYPEHTKQTRCNNNLNLTNNYDFFRPIISNTPIPISHNHENYMCDNNAISMYQYDLERSSISTRNNVIDSKKPVQHDFQNSYYTSNFDTLNNNSNDHNINQYLTRNPVNSRRDEMEKTRNNDREDFMKNQGGMLSNFTDFKCEYTRKDRNTINSSNYVPMARTMAIPKENI
jgi:hypothetical protein